MRFDRQPGHGQNLPAPVEARVFIGAQLQRQHTVGLQRTTASLHLLLSTYNTKLAEFETDALKKNIPYIRASAGCLRRNKTPNIKGEMLNHDDV